VGTHLGSQIVVGPFRSVLGFGFAPNLYGDWISYRCPPDSPCPIPLGVWLDPLFYASLVLGLLGVIVVGRSVSALLLHRSRRSVAPP